jgi:hypothetical protein
MKVERIDLYCSFEMRSKYRFVYWSVNMGLFLCATVETPRPAN